jgi:hypothetical protein
MLTAAALTIPFSAVAATATFGGTAWAAASITCTTITGTAASTLVVSGCTGGVTGGSSIPIAGTALALGGTIHWTSGSTTTIAAPTLTLTSNKKCPGYVKPPKGTTPPEPTAEKFSAVVTADTGDGIKVPGTSKGAVCISTTGAITALGSMKTK